MMSQRESGVEMAGEEAKRSGPAEIGGQRSAGDEMGTDGRRRSFASGLYREAVSFNERWRYNLLNNRRFLLPPCVVR
jgi:hypothetical protein